MAGGDVVQLHVPKTGGSALREGLRGVPDVVRWGHSYALKPPGDDRYLVTLRDPVNRFLSAFAFSRSRLVHRGFPDAESLARALAGRFSLIRDLVVFKPQIDWVYSAERLRQPDVLWVGITETLDADFERLRRLLDLDESHQLPGHGHKRRNEQTYTDTLSPAGLANVREYYREDHELLEGLI